MNGVDFSLSAEQRELTEAAAAFGRELNQDPAGGVRDAGAAAGVPAGDGVGGADRGACDD